MARLSRTVPEAWKLDWADTIEIAQAVDRAGMEALLPVGRWRGYGGPSDFNAGHGGYPLVGTAEQITNELTKLADIGVDGCLISWVDYKNELQQWNAEVLPLLEQAGCGGRLK